MKSFFLYFFYLVGFFFFDFSNNNIIILGKYNIIYDSNVNKTDSTRKRKK